MSLASIYLLASIICGEAGALGLHAEYAVLDVVANRLASPHYPNTVTGVATQFYGRATPTAECWTLARNMPKGDKDGLMYALSLQDRIMLGFPPGDRVYGSWPIQLHLYYEGSGAW